MKDIFKKYKASEILSIIGFSLFSLLTAYQGDFSSSIISANGLIWVFECRRQRLINK